MQEIQGIGGRSELIGDDAGDWTMKRSQQNLNRQLLKCPRCDSINTKFCYYNNYNLSQPRHFCKSCRRYWTKGGVLRSVPVGGGCRKTKRSKPKHSSETPESVIIKRNSDSHSNSDCESSSLTAITVAKAAETFFAPTLTSSPNLIREPEWYPFSSQTQNSPLQSAQLLEKSSDSELFSYNGSFSEEFPIGCSNFSGVTPFQLSSQGPHRDQNDHQAQHDLWNPWSFIEIGDEDEPSMPEIRAGFLDQTVEADLPPLQSRPNMEFGSFNHLEIGRLDFIDFPGAIEGNYWNDRLGSLPPEQKASSSFTRRGSVVYTKTPSRDSLSRRMDPKGRIIAQSIPTNKKREHGEKEQGKSVNPSDADSFSLFSAKSFSSEKEKEELVLLREQLEDLQKHLLVKDELLKSAENTKRQMTTISAKLDALKVQSAEKDAIMKSTHSQLSETKIKLADRQAALEKIQWEAMTSNRKVAKLEEELKTMHGDIMLLLESLAKDNSDVLVNDYDFAVCQLENDPSIDNLDEMEIEKIEEATKAYIAALAVAKEKQDEESIAAATAARLHLQSFVLGNNIADVHYTKHT